MTESPVTNIVVRPAKADDFEFVANLMVRALTPFYDGDHRAHARRIFDTHMDGGIDHVGHFSAGQHMFIAEQDGLQVGLIHVVVKKQGTVKISPLIVSTDYRGKLGIGSVLLKHAENFARSLGARQLYCTVASPNQKALQFFLRKGFRVTGMGKDHYKQGVDEYMLYKQLVDEAGFDSPNVSVIPFDEEVHADGARDLILSQMSDDFGGVDDDWVDALFAGYKRKELGDVNAKFKIIFIAECDGQVVGVAGATPKKGQPIKLMPLAASSETAFEAIVIDLQGLLEDYGHKLYVHLVPELLQLETGHTSGVVRIKSIRVYDSFADMLSSESWREIVPQVSTEAEALKLLRGIYPAGKERLGVHVIEVEKV